MADHLTLHVHEIFLLFTLANFYLSQAQLTATQREQELSEQMDTLRVIC